VQAVVQSLYCVPYLSCSWQKLVNLNHVHPSCMCSVVGYCKHLAPGITSKFKFIVLYVCIVLYLLACAEQCIVHVFEPHVCCHISYWTCRFK
jgi:hypothetical protein